MDFNDLAPEQQEKLRTVKTPEEILALAKEEGIELSDEQLTEVAGGKDWDDWTTYYFTCANCGKEIDYYKSSGRPVYCPYCGVPVN